MRNEFFSYQRGRDENRRHIADTGHVHRLVEAAIVALDDGADVGVEEVAWHVRGIERTRTSLRPLAPLEGGFHCFFVGHGEPYVSKQDCGACDGGMRVAGIQHDDEFAFGSRQSHVQRIEWRVRGDEDHCGVALQAFGAPVAETAQGGRIVLVRIDAVYVDGQTIVLAQCVQQCTQRPVPSASIEEEEGVGRIGAQERSQKFVEGEHGAREFEFHVSPGASRHDFGAQRGVHKGCHRLRESVRFRQLEFGPRPPSEGEVRPFDGVERRWEVGVEIVDELSRVASDHEFYVVGSESECAHQTHVHSADVLGFVDENAFHTRHVVWNECAGFTQHHGLFQLSIVTGGSETPAAQSMKGHAQMRRLRLNLGRQRGVVRQKEARDVVGTVSEQRVCFPCPRNGSQDRFHCHTKTCTNSFVPKRSFRLTMTSLFDDHDSLLTDLFNPRDTTFDDRLRMVSESMKRHIDKIESGATVHLVVMIDATQSMTPYLNKSRGLVSGLFRSLKVDMMSELNVAVVAYRDPVDDPEHSHVQFEFTTKKTVFLSNMKDIGCIGGADRAEDVAGGFQLVNDLLETIDDVPDTILVCHVTDAPAHGVCEGRDDNHDTDDERSRLQTQLTRLSEHSKRCTGNFQYMFFPVADMSRYEINLYRKFVASHLGNSWVHDNMRVCETDDFQVAFASSIFESVSSTSAKKDVTMNPFASALGLSMPDASVTDVKHAFVLKAHISTIALPSDTSAFLRALTAYTSPPTSNVSFLGSFSSFSRACVPPPPLVHKDCAKTLLRLETNAFSHGAERAVFHARVWSDLDDKTLEHLATVDDETHWQPELCASETMVVKVPISGAVPSGFTESKMAVHVPAMVLATVYNSMVKSAKCDAPMIQVAPPTVLSFPETTTRIKKSSSSVFVQTKKLQGQVVLVEPKLSGKYFKMWDNAGRLNSLAFDAMPDLDYLFAYVLISYVLTKGTYVPSDLQGVVEQKDGVCTIHLTDLAATCSNPLAFEDSCTNFGEPVLRKMVRIALERFESHPTFPLLFGKEKGLLKNAHLLFDSSRGVKRGRDA